MNETVEARARRAPFLWISTSAFALLVRDLPERQRSQVGWVYMCLSSAASESMDGNHEGFATTAEEIRALTGYSRPTFRTAIQALEVLGLLRRENRVNEKGTTVGIRYVLLEPRGASNLPPGGKATRQENCPPRARAGDRSRSEGKNKEEDTCKQTRASREQELRDGTVKLTYRRRKIPIAQAKLAANLLLEFNRLTGQHRQHFTPHGDVTENFKMVIGAVVMHPEVEIERWVKVLQEVLAHPWWSDGPPTVSVVFSAKVIDDNLEAPSRGGAQTNGSGNGHKYDGEFEAMDRLAGLR